MNRSGLIVDLVDLRSGEKEGTMNDKHAADASSLRVLT